MSRQHWQPEREVTGSYEPVNSKPGNYRDNQRNTRSHAMWIVAIAAACFTAFVVVYNSTELLGSNVSNASEMNAALLRPDAVGAAENAAADADAAENAKVGHTLTKALDQALRNEAALDQAEPDTENKKKKNIKKKKKDKDKKEMPPIPDNMCGGWTEAKYFSKQDCVNDPSLRGNVITAPGKRTSELEEALDKALISALREENCGAALQTPENARLVAQKLSKLANDSVFTFFRGSAGLFDDDMICYDDDFAAKFKDMPRVISNGDCHPENFGVQVMANQRLVWGVNDFDQAFQTPFAWDIKRGATGFELACLIRGWDIDKVCQKAAKEFARAYVATIVDTKCLIRNQDRFIEGSEATESVDVVKQMMDESRGTEDPQKVKEWLEGNMHVDLKKERFKKSAKTIPLPDSVIPLFQKAIDAYLFHGVSALALYPNDGQFYKVKAVAIKLGSGTGSVGLNRFRVLIGGRYTQGKYGRIVLEMKQEVNSMLEKFFRYQYTSSQEGKRAVDSEKSAYPYANVFFGWTQFRDQAYIVREKSKHAISVDLAELTEEGFLSYAMASGRSLAHYHVRARCADEACALEDYAAVDTEICEDLSKYINEFKGNGPHGEHFGPTGLLDMVTDFSNMEAVRQVDAWQRLRSMVQDLEEDGDKSILSLLGGEDKTKKVTN